MSASSGPGKPSRSGPVSRHCKTCGSRFSREGRFCPFDGSPLSKTDGLDPEDDPLFGALIDKRYRVLEVLGQGGMGTVYRVRHQALGKDFALKVLRSELAQDRDLSERFIHEARAAARVNHANVIQITDFGGLDTGQPFFIMELLGGRPLSDVIAEQFPVGAERCVRVLRQVAEALQAAHDVGIIHRDLKPDNIHVSEGDRVTVLDFGLARLAGASRLTRENVVYGTPHYMSPEQASGDSVDHRVDIYSLGVVMYELIVGDVPFDANTYMEVLTKHIYTTPVFPAEVARWGEHFARLQTVALRCLQKRPADRYRSMSAFIADLERASASFASQPARHRGAGARRAQDRTATERPPRSNAFWLAVLLGLAALGALLPVSIWFARSSAKQGKVEPVVAPRVERLRAASARPALLPNRRVTPPSTAPAGAPIAGPQAAGPGSEVTRARGPDHEDRAASAKVTEDHPKAPREAASISRGSGIIDPWAKQAPSRQ